MKKLIIILLVFVTLKNASSQNSWSLLYPEKTAGQIRDIFISDNFITFSGLNGFLTKIDSLGNLTNIYNYESNMDIVSSYFINDTGWAIQTKLEASTPINILYTENNGKTKKVLSVIDHLISFPYVTYASFNKIFFLNNKTGFATGNSLIKTTNGGHNWISINSFESGNKYFSVINDSVYYCLHKATEQKLYLTSNSGENWTLINTIDINQNPIYGINFINKNTGFLIRDDDILKTTDGGLNFINIKNIKYLRTFFVASENIYYTLEDVDNLNKLYKTENGGQSWEAINKPNGRISSISAKNDKLYLSLKFSEKFDLYFSENRGNSWTQINQRKILFNKFSYFSDSASWFYNNSGERIKLYYSGDNFKTFELMNNNISDIKFLKFNNSTTGYYQSGNKIFKSTNKGVTWSQFADLNNSTFQANDVKEISDSLKLILSYSSVFKSTDGGSSWSFYPFKEIYNYILGFTFIDNNIYSVTGSLNHSLFYKSTNYGETYSYLSGVYTSALHFQEGEDGNLYFYSNGPNLYGIVKSTNEGQTWSTIYQYANNQYISKVKVVNDSTFAISYDIDDVKITTNKGLTWKTFYFPSYYDALFFDKNNNFTAISENFIIKFNSGTPTNIYTESESVSGYELFQNYPNPFNPITKIKFNLKSNEYVSLKIYDISGKVVFNLINNIFHNAGVHEYEYNATNLSSGIYFYKLETDNFSSVKKMMLIK